MRNIFTSFLVWLATWQFSVGAVGSWNGVSFTAWNGVAQTAWNGTAISCAGTPTDYRTGLITELLAENANGGGASNGASVTSITNTGSNANNIGAGIVEPPTFQTNVQNGKPCIRFHTGGVGSSDLIWSSAETVPSAFTAVFVINGDAQSASYGNVMGDPTGTTGATYIRSSKKMNLFEGSDREATNANSGACVVSLVVTSGGAWEWFKNGTSNGSGTGIASPGFSATRIGNDQFGSILKADMFVWRIYNTNLSTGNRQSVEDYLGYVYNITITH